MDAKEQKKILDKVNNRISKATGLLTEAGMLLSLNSIDAGVESQMKDAQTASMILLRTFEINRRQRSI